MEVSSTKYDGTGMVLAEIPGNPVRTYERTPCDVIIGGPDGKLLIVGGFIESHLVAIFPPDYMVPFSPRHRARLLPALPHTSIEDVDILTPDAGASYSHTKCSGTSASCQARQTP
jgi:hypothetical protein